jgi:nucleoside-diphosphate-sugar epimerase
MKFTILGGSGFIGAHLAMRLRARGDDVMVATRDRWFQPADDLGHVVYCIGVTADFRTRTLETAQAHICRLTEVLQHGRFESLLYLSSTRVYAGAIRATEDATFQVDPARMDDVYNLSKLMGESLCLAVPDARVRVARLSNVFGPDWESRNFLVSVISEAVGTGALLFHTAPDSVKDYIGLEDVIDALLAIIERGTERIYNVASGKNVSNQQIAARLAEVCHCRVAFAPDAAATVFPVIERERLNRILDRPPVPLLDSLPALVEDYKRWKNR